MAGSRTNTVAWPQVLVVIVAFALLATLAQFTVRLGYGPDEPSHLEYIHILAWQHRLPTVDETHIVQHPPSYYTMMAVLWRLAGVTQRPLSLPRNYGALALMTDRAVLGRRVLRAASMLLGCATLLVLALTLAALGTPVRHQGWLLLLIAGNPMLQYISAVVGNEILAVFWSCVTCLVLVRRFRSGGLTIGGAAALGAVVGLGVWVKVTTLFCVPALVVVVWTAGPRRERFPRLVACFAAMTVVGGGWPLYCKQVSGHWFPNYVSPPDQASQVHRLLQTGRGLADIWLTMLATSMLPDWSTPFVSRFIPGFFTLFFWGLLALLPAILWQRPGARLRWLGLLSLVALTASILAQMVISDWRIMIGGRYLLNGAGWILVIFATSVPRRAAPPPPETGRTPPLTMLVGATGTALVLADAIWWYLVQLHYSMPPPG